MARLLERVRGLGRHVVLVVLGEHLGGAERAVGLQAAVGALGNSEASG